MFRRLFLPLLLVLATALHAQTVRWDPNPATLALNQVFDLNLVFDQCEPPESLKLPTVAGLEFIGQPSRATSSSYTVVNFKSSHIKTVTLTFRIKPTERRALQIPAFTVETDKGRLTVEAANFEVGEATVGRNNISLDAIIQSRFTLPSGSVWAGEVFPLTYGIYTTRRYFYDLGSDLTWTPAPLITESWSKPVATETTIRNEQRLTITYATRAYAKNPGAVTLSPASQFVNLTTGGTAGFGLFARQSLEQYSISSAPANLTVRPLPTPAPATFNGAVGKFTLNSTVVPANVGVGEPITWTLSFEGTGNWPDIGSLPTRSVSKDFRIVQPQAKRTNKEGALFDASISEDIVLIPTRAGNYTLGPVNVTIFNPTSGAYETLTTPSVTVQVAAAAAPNGSATTPTAATSSAKTPSGGNSEPPATPLAERAAAPAAAIPRDPLPTTGSTSIAPLAPRNLVIGLLASALLPLGAWMILALRRARQTDPARPLREAHDRLNATLRELANNAANVTTPTRTTTGAPNPAVAALLLAWQRDSAILWQLTVAVPTSTHFNNSEWATLWAEADRTLYGTAALPHDWNDRAHQALAARPAPAFRVWQLVLPRNLLPLALLLAATVLSTPAGFAADATEAYAKGDFAAAQAEWSNALKTAPTDWAAHHNLALALIQQNRANEGAGHALAAFVQQPQNPSVRWHLAYAMKAAGVSPAALNPFLAETPLAAIARLASPTRWQAVALASAWLTGLGLAWALYQAYSPAKRTVYRWLMRSLLILSLAMGTAAGLSLKTYGPLADAHAVVVVAPTTLRSIPTDLDTPQKSAALAVGVVAATDQAFLGWRRLVFPDGQTGWVRAETLVALW